jgi:acyl dehydratase
MTYFEDIVVGSSRVSHGRTVTETDIVAHAGQTGDFYPHHMDEEFARSQPYGRRIAHGTLVLSMAVGMLAGEVNEEAMSYGYDRVRFIRPVFIGDTIHVRSEISGVRDHARRPELGMYDEQLEVVNQRGETVLVLTKIYVVNRRPASAASPETERD